MKKKNIPRRTQVFSSVLRYQKSLCSRLPVKRAYLFYLLARLRVQCVFFSFGTLAFMMFSQKSISCGFKYYVRGIKCLIWVSHIMKIPFLIGSFGFGDPLSCRVMMIVFAFDWN